MFIVVDNLLEPILGLNSAGKFGNVYRRNRRIIKKLKIKDDAIINIETEFENDSFVEENDIETDDVNVPLQDSSQDHSSSGSEVYESADEGDVERMTRSGRVIRRRQYLNDYDLN